MKKLTWALGLVVVVLAVASGFWLGQRDASKVSISKPSPPLAVKPATPIPTISSLVKPGDLQEYRDDRETTLKLNPKLASEYKAILTEMDSQQKALEAAMVKANPKVAPVIAKLEAMRKTPAKPATDTQSSKPPTPLKLTQDELSQLRDARFAALQANPDFEVKAKELAAKLVAFQQKLSAAMVHSDPSVATVLAKMGPQHPQPASPPTSPSTKPD